MKLNAETLAEFARAVLLAVVALTLFVVLLGMLVMMTGGAPMFHFVELCGTHFGLKVYRHRQFESSELLFAPGPCSHPYKLLPGYVCVYGDEVRGSATGKIGNQYQSFSVAVGRAALGIDWMTQKELSQAIPPVYTEWLGKQLLTAIERAA